MNFDWQTEDVPEKLDEIGHEPALPGRGRGWTWLLAFLLLAVAGGYLLWQEANERIAEAQALAEENVRSSHRLLQRAIAMGDEELFLSLLSGRDDEWLQAQLKRLENGKLAAPAGLEPDGDSQIVSVELDADFTEAVLVARQPYTFVDGSGISRTIALEHSYVYRLGEQRWLFSPPQESFWGTEQVWSGDWLSLRYWERDRVVAPQLGSKLDQLLSNFCNLEGVRCPADLHLEVTLSTDVQITEDFEQLQPVLQAADESSSVLVLPSPTLIGMPPDGAGNAPYEALAQNYARPLVASALARSTDFGCCRGVPFFGALVQKQLSWLEVSPWALGSDEYSSLLLQGVDSLSANRLRYDVEAGDEWERLQALALVDFLESELGPEQLLAEGRGAYGLWLDQHNNDPDRFVAAWLGFIHAQASMGRAASASLPEGELLFSCRLDSGGVELISYEFGNGQPENGTWSELLQAGPAEQVGDGNAGFVDVVTLPGDYGYLVQEFTYGGMLVAEAGRLTWHPEGNDSAAEEIVIQEWLSGRDSSSRPRMIGYHPEGRYLVLADFVLPLRSDVPFTGPAWLVDLDRCNEGGCGFDLTSSPAQPLAGTPLWSPDGQQTLLQGQVRVDPGSGQIQYELHRADREGQNARAVGTGMSPFWLNDDYYGYLRMSERSGLGQESSEQELVIASVRDDQPHVVAGLDDFREVLDASNPPHLTFSGNVLALHSERSQLLVRAQSYGPGETVTSYAFLVELDEPNEAAEIELLFSSDQQTMVVPAPNGRWLAVREYDPTGWENSAFYLLDIETDQRQPLGTGGESRWSPDGRWLVRSYPAYSLLWEVETGTSHLIAHEQSRLRCLLDEWVDE